MQKDSSNHVGFAFNSGEIKTIVKDSSAARNGILVDHYLTEVNGQNVIGLKVGFYMNTFNFFYKYHFIFIGQGYWRNLC